MKIFFLDFDGVISTNRAYLANGADTFLHRDERWIDPIACAMIRDLCIKYGYKIVVSSTWRRFGRERIRQVLSAHNLWDFTHPDWCTDEIWPGGPGSSMNSRPTEIDDWIKRNGCDDYLILDDDGFNWTDHQRDRWIQSHTNDGFSTGNYEAVINFNS